MFYAIRRFPIGVWLLMAVEFFERLAYYGCTFSLTTYALSMLSMSVSQANMLINGLYAVSPLGALVGANIADGLLSRKRILIVAGLIYVAGLSIMAWSAMPQMYTNFPLGPTKSATALFSISVVVFGVGYGAMKAVISPLVGDCVVNLHGDSDKSLLSALYRLDYWVFNFGSLIGMSCLPMMRRLDTRKKLLPGQEDVSTGFYYSFWACAASTALGVLCSIVGYCYFPSNDRVSANHFYSLIGRAFWMRLKFAVGAVKDADFQKDNPGRILEYGLYGIDPTTVTYKEGSSLVSPMRDGFRACKVLAPLPMYWLIGGQFSSNVVLQASWMDLPSWVQPEAFNNVSTIALLAFMPLMESVIIPKLYPRRRPPVMGRMLLGFGLAALGMLYCGVLQIIIAKRGTFEADGTYIVHSGESKLSCLWMLVPFILQGIAGVFVDTTSLETAYTMTAPSMKSLIVAVYLCASAAAGFLGLAIAPLVTSDSLLVVYFALAIGQFVVMGLFKWLAGQEFKYIEDELEANLLRDTAECIDVPPPSASGESDF